MADISVRALPQGANSLVRLADHILQECRIKVISEVIA
jgi:hypothetical protein